MQRGCAWVGLELPVLNSQRFLKGAAPWSAGYGLEEEQWELCWTVGGAAGGLYLGISNLASGLPCSLGARVISLFPGTSNIV